MTTTNSTMISGYWVGSNQPIGPPFPIVQWSSKENTAPNKAIWLQWTVSKCIDADFIRVKVSLGSPNGPQLTRRLQKFCTAQCSYYGETDQQELEQKALTEAWTELENAPVGKTVNVYVTQYSAADVAVDNLVRHRKTSNVRIVFNGMSLKLRSNPKVALAAICLEVSYSGHLPKLDIPTTLRNHKQFVLHLAKVWPTKYTLERGFAFNFASPTLQKDCDVRALMHK
jgi:hypothetical protein